MGRSWFVSADLGYLREAQKKQLDTHSRFLRESLFLIDVLGSLAGGLWPEWVTWVGHRWALAGRPLLHFVLGCSKGMLEQQLFEHARALAQHRQD